MSRLAIIFSIATFCSTFLGGLFSIRFKDYLHYIMSFTAGVLLWVVSFDILPEIIELINKNNFNVSYIMIALVSGFLIIHILEKTVLIHHGHESDYASHKHPKVGMISALALIGHSFMDGVGIGLGFQISPAIGIITAIAVIAHDFTDGMNTVTLMLTHKNTTKHAKRFLALDAIAPVLGTFIAFWFHVPVFFLTIYLGFFAGFLLYIWASDILPEAHSKKSSWQLICLTVLGTIFTFVVTRFLF